MGPGWAHPRMRRGRSRSLDARTGRGPSYLRGGDRRASGSDGEGRTRTTAGPSAANAGSGGARGIFVSCVCCSRGANVCWAADSRSRTATAEAVSCASLRLAGASVRREPGGAGEA
eukprot:gene14321-biopygen11317